MSIPASSDPVRLALIGAGRWGRNYIRTIAGLPGAALVRLASSNPESHVLAPPGCVVDAHWRTSIAAPEVEAVIVSTPPASHAEITLAAIAAGKAVLVEKPLTLDLGEADAIARAAREAGAMVWVEHTQLFNPAWTALKAALTSIGPIRAIRSEAGNHGPYRKGGVPMLWDWGAHDIAQTLDLMGRDPNRVSAAWAARGEKEGGDSGDVTLTLAFDGIEARIRLCNTMDKARRFAVHGERGVLLFDDTAADKLTRHPSCPDFGWPAGKGDTLAIDSEMPLARAVRLFAQAVRTPRPGPSPLDLGLRVVRALAACG
ncbi:Gfo/Idh/MocA family protein [Paramagnetospirillum magneticum]|uniref:Predicted dehydrogenase and related protein n=1 Tax=Paramagnetospirillum magneticum (strain ATCC 700264 / AMB-1) TaxID=342108 RepID=Q2WB33_PARM1|nr:Gfo/Idh/MocA family oxidoreductase [Paramagnetospirillum magneticum]BAE48942.1 Predicted dehydrogenase and related protein [Paramagnetospirillum magneticum AMB-1]